MSDQGELSARFDDAAQSAADQQQFDVPSGGKPGGGTAPFDAPDFDAPAEEQPAFDAFPEPSAGAVAPEPAPFEASALDASVFRPPAVPMPQTGSQPLFVPETPAAEAPASPNVFGQAQLAQNAPVHTGPMPVFAAPVPQDDDPDLGSLDDGPGVEHYAGVDMSGPGTPPKPGTPSSGNWQMPEWMREETEANAANPDRELGLDETELRKDRSRTMMFAGIGVLLLALFVALGIWVLGGSDAGTPNGSKVQPVELPSPAISDETATTPPAAVTDKPLQKFKGAGSRTVGTITDTMAHLSYPQFAAPWKLPTKQNKLAQAGWSGQQIMVTEHAGTQLWYGTILSAKLSPVELSLLKGGNLKETTVAVAASLENRLYAFKHGNKPIASQAITVDGHKGWLIGSYYTFKRAGIKATGEVVVTAMVETGGKVPSVLFVSVPNTAKTMWPIVNTIFAQLKVIPAT